MVILQAIATEQSFSFIPRSQTYDTLLVQNEATGEKLTLKNGTTIVHKDRIFCTNQTPVVNYSVNDGQYTSNVSNNEFIIYE
jgi:hypothetical protein